MSTFAEVMGN